MNDNIREQMKELMFYLGASEGRLELLINSTPTGVLRNRLTDANINLMMVISIVKELNNEATYGPTRVRNVAAAIRDAAGKDSQRPEPPGGENRDVLDGGRKV